MLWSQTARVQRKMPSGKEAVQKAVKTALRHVPHVSGATHIVPQREKRFIENRIARRVLANMGYGDDIFVTMMHIVFLLFQAGGAYVMHKNPQMLKMAFSRPSAHL